MKKILWIFTSLILIIVCLLLINVFSTQSKLAQLPYGQSKIVASLSEPLVDGQATLLSDGKVLITGEYDRSKLSSDCQIAFGAELFDPATNSFKKLDDVIGIGFYHTATLLNNGNVLLAGGRAFRCGRYLKSAVIFDHNTQKFQRISDMNFPRDEHTAILLPDNTVLIIGGVENTEDYNFRKPPKNFNFAQRQAEIFNPSVNKFINIGSANSDYGFPSATLLNDGNILIAGGKTYESELYDSVKKEFLELPKMTYRRVGNNALKLSNGKVLLIGGETGGPANVNTIEEFDPVTKKFNFVASIQCHRIGAALALLPNDRVLITGGVESGNTCSRNTIIFNYPEKKLEPFQDMKDDRSHHQMPVLKDGSILVIGGKHPRTARPIKSIELFTIAT